MLTALQPLPSDPRTNRITDMRKAKAKVKTSIAWSKDEVKLLKELFPQGGAREIAERVGRSLVAVRQKAYYMGIRTSEHRFWSANEVQLLKKLYQDENAQSIADKLGRSLKAVKGKASAIGLKKQGSHPWSSQEIALLKKHHPDNTARDIASQLGRTVLAVQQKASKLGLSKSIRVWSKRELNLLKRLYPKKEAEQIAEQLGRPVQATRLRIVKLGLRKRFRYEDCHRVVNVTKEKLCRRCRKWKGESHFYINRSSKDGLLGWCKKCSSADSKKRRSSAKS
jgi:hypothetical protein